MMLEFCNHCGHELPKLGGGCTCDEARVERMAGQVAAETVDHPAHYGGGENPYEAIKVIEAWGLDFCLGNTVKYISRAGKKGDIVTDLKKAAWYLQRRIAQLETEAT